MQGFVLGVPSLSLGWSLLASSWSSSRCLLPRTRQELDKSVKEEAGESSRKEEDWKDRHVRGHMERSATTGRNE